jgi:hypothetical protein
LREQAVEFMQTSFWDMNPCLQLNGTTTQPEYCADELQTDGLPECTCTTQTCDCLMHPNTKAEWIAYMRDSLAKIFQSPVLAQALTESEAACGAKWLELLAIWSHENCFWKTAQQSLVEDLDEFCETWPSWGLMRDGVCYRLRELVPRTYALDGGASPDWQTPVADDSMNRAKGKYNSRGELKLSAQVKIPTPTVHGNYNRKGASKNSGDGLATFAKMFPTPRATDADKNCRTQEGVEREIARKGSPQDLIQAVRMYPTPRASDKNGHQIAPGRQGGDGLNQRIGGQLNPTWVEWLMGWPIGATE